MCLLHFSLKKCDFLMRLLHFTLSFFGGALCQTLVFLMFFIKNLTFFESELRKIEFF